MKKPFDRDRRAVPIVIAGLGCALGLALTVAPATAAVVASDSAKQAAGFWDMSLNDTSRKCRLGLRLDPETHDFPIAMPAGCRKAMPILSTASKWEAESSELTLLDDNGQPVLTFSEAGAPTDLVAKGPEGETYHLIPASPGPRLDGPADPVKVAQNDAAPAPPAAPAVAAGPDAADVPGRYDILRTGAKDSGCMLTLDGKAKGLKGGKKASLAPACRDHGIVVFNPVGWRLEDGQLVLTAKRGHETKLVAKPDGTWAKESKEGAPLILRKM